VITYLVKDTVDGTERRMRSETLDDLRKKLMSDPPANMASVSRRMDDRRYRTIGYFSHGFNGESVWRSDRMLKGTIIDPFTGRITL